MREYNKVFKIIQVDMILPVGGDRGGGSAGHTLYFCR